MLAAIKEMASYRDEVTKKCHLETANYLEACNKLFEMGILSHEIIDSLSSQVLLNMKQGFGYSRTGTNNSVRVTQVIIILVCN